MPRGQFICLPERGEAAVVYPCGGITFRDEESSAMVLRLHKKVCKKCAGRPGQIITSSKVTGHGTRDQVFKAARAEFAQQSISLASIQREENWDKKTRLSVLNDALTMSWTTTSKYAQAPPVPTPRELELLIRAEESGQPDDEVYPANRTFWRPN